MPCTEIVANDSTRHLADQSCGHWVPATKITADNLFVLKIVSLQPKYYLNPFQPQRTEAMRKQTLLIAMVAASIFLTSCAGTREKFPTKSFGRPYENPQIVSGMLFKPEGKGSFPAVVLLHTCGGLLPHVTQDWPNYLTDLGYVVLSVDSYGPRWVGSCDQLVGHKILQAEDAYGALEYLANLPFVDADRIGVIGFSAGAIAINSVLANQMKVEPRKLSFQAAIAMYGLCRNLFNYGEASIPLMEIVAEHDKLHAVSCIYAGKNFPNLEVHVLPGAYHAFDKIGGSGKRDSRGSYMLYSKTATEQARELTKDFLARHLRN